MEKGIVAAKIVLIIGVIALVLSIVAIRLEFLLTVAVVVAALGITVVGFLFLRMLQALRTFIPKK